jgi:hypothetical protein
MPGSMKRMTALKWVRAGISGFVSRLRPAHLWYDAHLPIAARPLGTARPTLPAQRSIASFMEVSRDE